MGSENESFPKSCSGSLSKGFGDDFGSHFGSQEALKIDSKRDSEFVFFLMISGMAPESHIRLPVGASTWSLGPS